MDAVGAGEPPSERQCRPRVGKGGGEPTDAGVIAAETDAHRFAGLGDERFKQVIRGALERGEVGPRWADGRIERRSEDPFVEIPGIARFQHGDQAVTQVRAYRLVRQHEEVDDPGDHFTGAHAHIPQTSGGAFAKRRAERVVAGVDQNDRSRLRQVHSQMARFFEHLVFATRRAVQQVEDQTILRPMGALVGRLREFGFLPRNGAGLQGHRLSSRRAHAPRPALAWPPPLASTSVRLCAWRLPRAERPAANVTGLILAWARESSNWAMPRAGTSRG